jgi:hypothetical protein
MRKAITIRTSHIFAAIAGVALIGSMAGSCDSFTEPFKDAPRSYRDNGEPMDVIRGADGFSNVGSKCDGYGGRVFMAYHGGKGTFASVTDVPYGLLKPTDPCRNQG